MNKKNITAMLVLIALSSLLTASILSGCGDPGDTATPDSATPDSATVPAATSAPEATSSPLGTTAPDTAPVSTAPAEPATKAPEGEELVFSEVFADFPVNFVSHGGKPGDENPGESYMHATLKIEDGKITGDFFSNLESTETETVEHKSNWTGTIRNGKVYRTEDGSYYIYVDSVKYDKEPLTSEKADGKTVNYVYGFGLDPEENNRLNIFTPETRIDSLISDDVKMDLRQFLTMMMKDGEAETLGCYMIRGKVDNCYVSITEEEAAMAPPDRPGPPEGEQ